ncbi:Exosortase EpsH-related protein [Desulfurococcus amylolyticus DSM 16532]|uniref:Exosortase EpsH-related protein n=1 Tax=Desulfurococcus amylolyticus DSM 16532 TaxID=768672 RepID=I3XS80_DESAM|nr:Exosortase EpsH-related protein [Desulfurococcus amylolyticus DSM 16532]
MEGGDGLRRFIYSIMVTALISSLLTTLYRDSIIAYLEELQVSEYSYLILLTPSSIFIIHRLTSLGSMGGFNIYKLISTVGTLAVSMSLYTLSRVVTEYSLQLEMYSLVLIIATIVLFIYGGFEKPWVPLAIIPLLLSMVPLPIGFISELARLLTAPLVITVSFLTGSPMVSTSMFQGIIIWDNEGVQRILEIAPECSGVGSLLTVLSLIPWIVYLSSQSRIPWPERIKGVAKSILVAALIVFAGNVARLALIVYVSRALGFDTAMSIFHYNSPVIYTGLATLTALLIAPKPSFRAGINAVNTVSRGFNSVDAAKILLLLFMVALYIAIALHISLPFAGTVYMNPVKLVENPASIVFNSTNTYVWMNTPSPLLGKTLGALSVYNIGISSGSNIAVGYVEVAESPSRFHGWQICLINQGYNIEKWWSEARNTTIVYTVISKDSTRLLLAYSVYMYPTGMGNLYVRISLFTPADGNLEDKAYWLNTILNNANIPSDTREMPLDSIMWSLYLGIALMLLPIIAGVVNARAHYFSLF